MGDQGPEQLAMRIVQQFNRLPQYRLIIGVSGIPASGKSTLAKSIVDSTNALLRKQYSEQLHPQAILVALDGWHLTRAQLDAFPNAKSAHDRRGSHWTFDAEGYKCFVQALRRDENTIITAPSFDHAIKDPTPAAVSIHPHHRIVVIEGLYTYLSIDPWRAAGEVLDERWFVQISPEQATARLVRRHVESGVAKDVDEASRRAEGNDTLNGQFVIDNMMEPTMVIQSVDNPVS